MVRIQWALYNEIVSGPEESWRILALEKNYIKPMVEDDIQIKLNCLVNLPI